MSREIQDITHCIGEDLQKQNESGQSRIVTPNRIVNKKNIMNNKTEIEIELSETVAYSKRSEKFECFCPGCRSLVEMATPQVAAILSHISEREIYRLVETGRVHFVETDKVLICLKSLTETLPESPAISVGNFLKRGEPENLDELLKETK